MRAGYGVSFLVERVDLEFRESKAVQGHRRVRTEENCVRAAEMDRLSHLSPQLVLLNAHV